MPALLAKGLQTDYVHMPIGGIRVLKHRNVILSSSRPPILRVPLVVYSRVLLEIWTGYVVIEDGDGCSF